jgi:PAS domain S-box-containing protein
MLTDEKFHTLLEAAPDAIVIADQAGGIVLVNAQAEKMFGYSRDELLGESIELLMPERFRTRHRLDRESYFRCAHARPMGANLELQALHKDGREFPVEISLSPFHTDDGTLVISAIRDVTVYRAAVREAKSANRIKDEFLATLSHELRTPLTAILGWSSMLAAGSLDASGSPRAVQSIARSARQLAQLVDDVLDVSRIVSGSLHMDIQSVALSPVIEAAVDTIRPSADAKSIGLHVFLDSATVMVAGDSARLQQIVWNLLSNAVKNTPDGGHVHVTLRRARSRVEIVVSDTGRGISPEFLPFVFDRFRQENSGSTRTTGGLGLGLAIVRQLVDLHGGSVRAESGGDNLGATFTVTLPIQAVHADGLQPVPGSKSVPLVDARAAAEIPDLQGATVLIVDDEQETRELLEIIVGQAGAETMTAPSAAGALEILERRRPDLILCDIGMPHEDGYSLIRKLRSRSAAEGGRIPAVALTAYARAEDRKRSLLAGFQSHMAKPAEPAELLALIGSLVGRTGTTGRSCQPV